MMQHGRLRRLHGRRRPDFVSADPARASLDAGGRQLHPGRRYRRGQGGVDIALHGDRRREPLTRGTWLAASPSARRARRGASRSRRMIGGSGDHRPAQGWSSAATTSSVRGGRLGWNERPVGRTPPGRDAGTVTRSDDRGPAAGSLRGDPGSRGRPTGTARRIIREKPAPGRPTSLDGRNDSAIGLTGAAVAPSLLAALAGCSGRPRPR